MREEITTAKMSINWGDVSIFPVAEILEMRGLLQDSVSLVLDDERDSQLTPTSHHHSSLESVSHIGPQLGWTDRPRYLH